MSTVFNSSTCREMQSISNLDENSQQTLMEISCIESSLASEQNMYPNMVNKHCLLESCSNNAGENSLASRQSVDLNEQEKTDSSGDVSELCFVCSSQEKNGLISIKASASYSRAPLLVLLSDILGYKFPDKKLHATNVCESCFRLLDVVDELLQTLAESKSSLRTRFLETVQNHHLKYPRTEKILKSKCLRCIRLSRQSAFRKKATNSHLSKNVVVLPFAKEDPAEDPERSKEVASTDGSEMSLAWDAPLRGSCGEANDFIYDTDAAVFSKRERLKVGIVRGDEESVEGKFACAYCRSCFESASLLKMHNRASHLPTFVDDCERSQNSDSSLSCRIGVQLRGSTEEEEEEDASPSRNRYVCLACTFDCDSKNILKRHFWQKHR